jgi:hypothetical protein
VARVEALHSRPSRVASVTPSPFLRMRGQRLASALRLGHAPQRTTGQCAQRRWCASATDQSQSVDPRETAKFEADADHWCASPLARPGVIVVPLTMDTWACTTTAQVGHPAGPLCAAARDEPDTVPLHPRRGVQPLRERRCLRRAPGRPLRPGRRLRRRHPVRAAAHASPMRVLPRR